jgi:hypothetical protein
MIMAMYFEQGTLPNGDKADMFVLERGVGDKAVFPADALTPDGQTTYREKYGAVYDAYKNGGENKQNLDPSAHPANSDLANSPGAFPGQPSGAPPVRAEPAQSQTQTATPVSQPAPQLRPEPETVRPPANQLNIGPAKSATDNATASKT